MGYCTDTLSDLEAAEAALLASVARVSQQELLAQRQRIDLEDEIAEVREGFLEENCTFSIMI